MIKEVLEVTKETISVQRLDKIYTPMSTNNLYVHGNKD